VLLAVAPEQLGQLLPLTLLGVVLLHEAGCCKWWEKEKKELKLKEKEKQ